jgi:hypothetical protein
LVVAEVVFGGDDKVWRKPYDASNAFKFPRESKWM